MKTKMFYAIPALFLFTMIVSPTYAQEVQMRFCDGTRTISQSAGWNLTLFKDVPGFKEASLYKTAQGAQFLEITSELKGELMRERRAIGEAELQILCNELSQKAKSMENEAEYNFKGARTRIITTTMVATLGYYSWAIPLAFDSESGKTYAASYLLGTSAGFFGSFLLTRGKNITQGMAMGYQSGVTQGILHGWALTGAILNKKIENNGRSGWGISSVTSIGEGLLAYHWSKTNNLHYGKMATISVGGTWGLLEGGALSYVLNFDNPRAISLSALGFSGLGIYGGYLYAQRYNPGYGNASVVSTMGFLGTYLPLAIMLETDMEIGRPQVGLLMGTSLASLALGVLHTNKVKYSKQQGYLVSLGAAAGALAGAGVSVLVEDFSPLYLASGALCGFIFTDLIVRSDIRKESKNQRLSLKFDINPMPLLAQKAKSTPSKPTMYVNGAPLVDNSIVKMRVTF